MTQRVSSLARLFSTEPENDWRPDAACRGLDPELFFSSEDVENRQERRDTEADAKAVCARCPVAQACLDYALEAGERYGIWGGLNSQERRDLRRAAARPRETEQVS